MEERLEEPALELRAELRADHEDALLLADWLPQQKVSEVSALVCLLYKATVRGTFKIGYLNFELLPSRPLAVWFHRPDTNSQKLVP